MKNIDDILARYFGGIASDNDKLELEKWLAESTANQGYFDEMTKLYEQLGLQSALVPKPDTAAAKKTFMAYIAKSEPTKQVFKIQRKPFYNRWMFQAASVAIVILIAVGAWIHFTTEREMVLATQTTAKTHVLPDQTQIKLSTNSKIIYSSLFGKNNKKIRLVGEAVFNVGHKGNGTLQISADETIIEDIGTVFSVSSYPDSANISVNVREGQVHFYTNSNNGLNLKANQTGIYNKETKKFRVYSIQKDSITATIKHVQFNGVTLKDVAEIVGKEYGITIKLNDPNIGNREITVSFDGENVDMVLLVIAKTLDLEIKKDVDGYAFYNKTVTQ